MSDFGARPLGHPKHHQTGVQKFTREQVLAIRRQPHQQCYIEDLAELLEVSLNTIYAIQTGATYAWVVERPAEVKPRFISQHGKRYTTPRRAK